MSQTPLVNHWWQVTLYITRRGLTTGAIPHRGGSFDLELDVIAHDLRVRSSAGAQRFVGLSSRPVADFYAATMRALEGLGMNVVIDARPNGVDPAIPFPDDDQHSTYDPAAAALFWQQLVQADRCLGESAAWPEPGDRTPTSPCSVTRSDPPLLQGEGRCSRLFPTT